ncbi:MAG: hypothetical protein HY080_03855 [Gammaproteobacteria bacterium]|nr:hypothetical protein [Gammaproteobacteria bacterium]
MYFKIDHTGLNASALFTWLLSSCGVTSINEGKYGVAEFGESPTAEVWVIKGAANIPPVHGVFRIKIRTQVDAEQKCTALTLWYE